MPLKDYFEELMRRRPTSVGGYINLPKSNFANMTDKAKTAEDFETLKYAFVQFTGHRNILPNQMVDNLLLKALKLNQTEQMHDFLKFHAELLYHPSGQVVNAYFKEAAKEYTSLKSFFAVVQGRYMMKRHVKIHNTVMVQAFQNGDKDISIDAYLDVLDYSGVSKEALVAVAESMSYVECIDHVLFGHLKDQMEDKKVDSRLYAAVYYFNVNGGLTAADLLNSLANDVEGVMPNSVLFKEQLMDKIDSDDLQLDHEVKDSIRKAIKNLETKMDKQFYGLEQAEAVEEQQEEETTTSEEKSDQSQEQKN